MNEHFEPMRARGDAGDAWFGDIARRLLLETDLLIARVPYRLREIEFYYDGPGHEDPFAHGEDIQKTFGRWYFHRASGSYRGGSFKGLDISFGPEGVVGGILIRTIESPEGDVVNGCSLCVDRILALTGDATVSELDGRLGEARVWEDAMPLRLAPRAVPYADRVYATARVGLTLKRLSSHPSMPEYLMRRYRFLGDPRIEKGRLHTIMSLHQDGVSPDAIASLTGSRRHTIDRYVASHVEGESLEGFSRWSGEKLSSVDLCQIHGLWRARFA